MSNPKPSPQQIEIRAYEIYLIRGCEDGHAEEDWLAAEQELQRQFERDLAEEVGPEQSISAEPEPAPKARAASASQRPSTSASSGSAQDA